MKTYKLNAVMAGLFYLLGSVFGITSALVGGQVIASLVKAEPLNDIGILDLVSANLPQLLRGSFFILLMGISLVAMTVFLYPIFRRDSEELAMGMVLFRGALEGTWYFITTLSMLALFALGKEYTASGANVSALVSVANALYKFQDLLGPVGTIMFLIGSTCLYTSFYRTRIIPRWLSTWGLVGLIPYAAYALLHYFRLDNGIGLYLQMVLAVQEIVMALWLIIKGFEKEAIVKLMASGLEHE